MTINTITDSSFTVQANQSWQNTGINVPQGVAVTINYQNGAWTANPNTNGGILYNAGGDPDLIVPPSKTGYPMSGVPEGALIGKLGDSGVPFFIGNSAYAVPTTGNGGDLQLVINDDLTGEYGSGLADNIGSIDLNINGADIVTPLSDTESALVDTINTTWTAEHALSELKTSLQTAVEIELATLPLYLYTYYSINRTPEGFPSTDLSRFANKAGGIIMSVAVEEMLHMSLASNLLYSLGQQPVLYGKSPVFPSNLPGHAQLGPDGTVLSLALAKLSVDQLWSFLEVEYPAKSDAPPEGTNWETIGQIYSYIRCIISSNLISDADFNKGGNGKQIQSSNYSPNNIDTVYPSASFNKTAPVPTAVSGSAASVAVYPSREDSHAGKVELISVDSCITALQAIQTIDAQGEGYGPSKFDDPSQHELSHYYKFLTLQSELAGYQTADPKLPKAPTPPLPAVKQYSEAELKSFVFNFPDNPLAIEYPSGRKDVADVVSGLYQYMLIMTESIFLQDPKHQKKYFNQSLHRSMIWILDKVIQAMRKVTLDGEPNGISLAPTFENIDLGPRDKAFSNLVALCENLDATYGDQSWYNSDIQYYVKKVSSLPDVSDLWPSSSPDLTKYKGIPVFPQNPPTDQQLVDNAVRHACMGLNQCKNQGRTLDNNCAGQGYCSTALEYNYANPATPHVSDHTCHVQNNCAGQGGCGLYGTAEEQNNPNANDCATLGSCATPINAERFSTDGPNRGKSVWTRARQVFEEKTWPTLKETNPTLPTLGPVPHPNLFQYGPTIEWIQDYSGEGMTACGASGMSGAGSCS